jgi:hypothetical protein
MKTMRTGLRLLIVAVLYSSFVEPSALCGDSDWVSYENRKVGLTFRHPPELWTREAPDYIRAGLDARAVIELVGKTELNPDTIVLRFIIDPFKGPPFKSDSAGASDYLARERTGCKSSSDLTIDGHRALNCVSCGRGSCSWTVMLAEPVRCNILTFADSETFGKRTAMRPHDSRFPILSILRTLHFSSDPGAPK